MKSDYSSKAIDNKSKKKKIIFLTISCFLLIIFLIGGIIVKLPVLLLISVYALIITNFTLINNTRILNSISIPFTFNYLFVMIYDISQLNILFAMFHLVTVIPCIIIFFRLNVNLILMLITSFFYALWIYLIMVLLEFPYYQCIFGVCNKLDQFFIVLLIGVITSVLGSNNKLKRILVKFMAKKIYKLLYHKE